MHISQLTYVDAYYDRRALDEGGLDCYRYGIIYCRKPAGGLGVIIVDIKKDLIRIETVDKEVLLPIADLLKRIERKYPDHLEVIKVDESNRTILFMSSSYVAANISRILMEEKEQSTHNEKEGILKVERQEE